MFGAELWLPRQVPHYSTFAHSQTRCRFSHVDTHERGLALLLRFTFSLLEKVLLRIEAVDRVADHNAHGVEIVERVVLR